MSYILDALRKADAERESGAVPDLHAQQYVTMPADDEPRGHAWLFALAGVLAAALLGVLAWVWLGREAPRDRVVMAVTPANGSSTATAPVVTPSPPTTSVTSPPTTVAPIATTPSSTAPFPAGATPTTATATPARSSKVKAPSLPATTSTASTSTPPPVTEPATLATGRASSISRPAPNAAAPVKADGGAVANRVYQTAELPEAIRRELPPVAVNGSSYAADAATRVLIANGQVLHEGDTVAPGLQLEKIGRRSATLSFKGYRYELTY